MWCDGASNLGCILVFQSSASSIIIQKGSNDGNGNDVNGNDGNSNSNGGNADHAADGNAGITK